MSQTRQRLTKKQKGFVKDYVETENGTQAALKNYDTNDYKTASVIAAENLDKPSIRVAIENHRKTLKQALIDKGITEDYLATKVETLLEAKTATGEPDYNAVDKGLRHATGFYGVDTEPEKQTKNTYNFIFNQDVQNQIREIESKIKEKLIQKHERTEEN